MQVYHNNNNSVSIGIAAVSLTVQHPNQRDQGHPHHHLKLINFWFLSVPRKFLNVLILS